MACNPAYHQCAQDPFLVSLLECLSVYPPHPHTHQYASKRKHCASGYATPVPCVIKAPSTCICQASGVLAPHQACTGMCAVHTPSGTLSALRLAIPCYESISVLEDPSLHNIARCSSPTRIHVGYSCRVRYVAKDEGVACISTCPGRTFSPTPKPVEDMRSIAYLSMNT